MWAPGAKFGKYKLVERLGKGGMAETWRGELLAAEGVRKAVVIKRVLPSFSDNKEFIEAFVQEAKVTASLSHGNVAQVFDFGQVGDSHFIAMELIDGRSLDRVLKHGIARGYWHMPYPIATLIMLEVAKGLEHVHTRRGPRGPLGIVHRDVSPDNIIVGLNGETKLVDFGVAKSVLAGRQETEAGVIKGKYIYFSPEQAAGEKVDFRTDIYALGVVMYRLVTGRKAFDGPGLKVLGQIQRGDCVPLRVANPDVPDELASVIEAMMATRKEDRYQTTLELVEALSAVLVHMAPRAGVHWIRDYVRWLYEADLKKRGEEPELRSGFLDLIEGWKPDKKPNPSVEMVSGESRPDEMATIASRKDGHQRRATGYEAPPVVWTARKKLYAGLAGAGAMALLAGFVALTSTRDPHEGESDEARNRRLAEATRMKPLEPLPGQPVAKQPGVAAPVDDEGVDPKRAPPGDEPPPPKPVVTADPPESAPREPAVAYDADVAPVTFMLTRHHQVSLDSAPVLPSAAGTLTGAKPLLSGITTASTMSWNSHARAGPLGGSAAQHAVPAFLFAPGKPPAVELLADSARWSREGTRLAMLVGSSGETPIDPFVVSANGKPMLARNAAVIVDSTDRFSIRDLSAQPTWKVTLTAKPTGGESAGPVVAFFRGEGVRVDGAATVGGYAVLKPGVHRVSGATSVWLTVPTVPSLELAPLEVSFAK